MDGNDSLDGGPADDNLYGGAGLDYFDGAGGIDLCDGVPGSSRWAASSERRDATARAPVYRRRPSVSS